MSTNAINESERNSSEASTAQANTQLAESASHPSIFGAAADTAMSGASAYAGAYMMENMGRGAPTYPGTFDTPASYYSDLSDALIGSDM